VDPRRLRWKPALVGVKGRSWGRLTPKAWYAFAPSGFAFAHEAFGTHAMVRKDAVGADVAQRGAVHGLQALVRRATAAGAGANLQVSFGETHRACGTFGKIVIGHPVHFASEAVRAHAMIGEDALGVGIAMDRAVQGRPLGTGRAAAGGEASFDLDGETNRARVTFVGVGPLLVGLADEAHRAPTMVAEDALGGLIPLGRAIHGRHILALAAAVGGHVAAFAEIGVWGRRGCIHWGLWRRIGHRWRSVQYRRSRVQCWRGGVRRGRCVSHGGAISGRHLPIGLDGYHRIEGHVVVVVIIGRDTPKNGHTDGDNDEIFHTNPR